MSCLCAGNFYDFTDCVASDRVSRGYQYIFPNLTFPCDGVVTNWRIGSNARGSLYLQIWRLDGANYNRIEESLYFTGSEEVVAEVSTNMTVSAGDVAGIFVATLTGIELEIAPVPDHTFLQGSRSDILVSPSGTFHSTDISSIVMGSSPLVTVAFGKVSIHDTSHAHYCTTMEILPCFFSIRPL